MIERLISFAGSGSGAYGAVVLGSDGDPDAAAAYVGGPEGGLEIPDVTASRGDGVLRLQAGDGEAVIGLAAQTSPLGFETGPGRSVSVQAVGASLELSGSAADLVGPGFEATGVAWTLEGESDQSSLRTAFAALADGSMFVIFGLRPSDGSDHGAETIGAARIAKDGAVTSYAEPLLSTEYDATGAQTRATLELWADEESGLPTRGAGRRELGGRAALGEGALEAARFEWRLDGVGGFGGYEIFS